MVKEKFLRPQKASQYYENDCLQKFLLLYMGLLTIKFVKKSFTYATITHKISETETSLQVK